MYKFGKIEPRHLDSFGVAGLLHEEGTVLYEGIFSTKNVGRVSDLLSARFQKAGTDEFRLRAVLTFSLFQAYRAQMYNGDWIRASDAELDEPIIIECGIDSEKLAVGVSCNYATAELINVEGLVERLVSKAPKGDIELTLAEMLSFSDKLVIRVQPDIRRFEVVCLLAIPGQIDLTADRDSADPELIVLEKAPTISLKIKEYVELGDLNYSELLKTGIGSSVPPAVTGEELITTVAGVIQNADNVARLVAGTPQAAVASTMVKGTAVPIDQTRTTVTGQNTNEPEVTNVVKGSAPQPVQQMEYNHKIQIQAMQNKIAQLEEELEQKSKQSFSAPAAIMTIKDKMTIAGVKAAPQNEETVVKEKGLGGFLKKMWPFKQPAAASAAVSEPESTGPIIVKEAEVQVVSGDATAIVQDLEATVVNGSLEQAIKNLKKQKDGINGKLSKEAASGLVDGVLNSMLQEQAKLKALTKKVATSVRQKELEIKSRESLVETSLRERDNQIRQKDIMLDQQKEQVTKLSEQLDRLKQATQGAAKADLFQKKYDHVQTLYMNLQKEAESVRKEVSKLKRDLEQAQKPDSRLQALDKATKLAHAARDEMEKMRIRMEHKDKEVTDLRAQLTEAQRKRSDRRAS